MYMLGGNWSQVDSVAGFALGTILADADGNLYKYVLYNSGASDIPAVTGQVAYYFSNNGYKDNEVTSDLSNSVEIGAGVLQSAPTDGAHGWIQIKGAATLSIALTAGANGDPLTPTGATDGTLDLYAAFTSNICAIAGDISEKEIVCDFPF